MMPSGNAISTEKIRPTPISSMVGPSRSSSRSVTGRPLTIENPRSPVSALPAQRRYWTTIG